MTDRERLIEILKVPIHPRIGADPAEVVADYLLANGVIVPPCKVGQEVYDIGEYVLGVVAPDIYELRADEMTIEKGADGALNFVYDGMYINNEDIGKTLFFTEAEAENALIKLLEERVDNG